MSKSGKPSPGYQGQGAAAGTKHLSTNPNKAKPAHFNPSGSHKGGTAKDARIANPKGGDYDARRNNPNVRTGKSRCG